MHNNFNLDNFIADFITGRSDSLLNSDLHKYKDELEKKLSNRSVLVIGAAGTIGSSFVKSILKYPVKSLFAIDINENGLTELIRDLRSSRGYKLPDVIKTYPINFGDTIFYKILESEGPFDIIANFAAHKHVRSEKDPYSIEAMLNNNVVQPKEFLDNLVSSPPEHFFCVSTDKAANPVNVMGASKKLMEELILSYSDKIPITTARFANVAFSNGSLLFGFLERIMKRQPLSSPIDIQRYFLSPEESGELCMLACIIGRSGDIIFPKLDYSKDMIKFSDIGLNLLRQLGYEPHICNSEEEARNFFVENPNSQKYPIYLFESDTSGEKSFEEFYTKDEKIDDDVFVNLGVIKQQTSKNLSEIMSVINDLESVLKKDNVDNGMIISVLSKYLLNFDYINKGKNLDQRM
ncbi:polysaccharide biosynthesis protein [Marine Group III euryarchaeote]|nr:polysaccharide biosynthesis protein [Marine Group III euryarchaeote]